MALPVLPVAVDADAARHSQHDGLLESLFSAILPLSCLSYTPAPLPLQLSLPSLLLARALPPPPGSSHQPPSSKKQESQAAPPLKRLRDAMYAITPFPQCVIVTLCIMHALCFESRCLQVPPLQPPLINSATALPPPPTSPLCWMTREGCPGDGTRALRGVCQHIGAV